MCRYKALNEATIIDEYLLPRIEKRFMKYKDGKHKL